MGFEDGLKYNKKYYPLVPISDVRLAFLTRLNRNIFRLALNVWSFRHCVVLALELLPVPTTPLLLFIIIRSSPDKEMVYPGMLFHQIILNSYFMYTDWSSNGL
jgi:hypothetical protein